MKSKEIFEAIDLSKVGPELKMKLVALEKATEGFTNDRADARMDASLLALYNSLKEKKPEALKNVEVKTTQVEEKVTKIENGKKVTRTRKTTKKVAGKKKSVKKKTPRPSQPLRKATVSNVAREIRKPGESWSDALTRAKKVFNDKKQAQSAKAKKALDDLRDFMTSDKYLKGWPRTYGKENPKNNDLVKDLARKAEAPGRRVSDTGRVYYENRDNRSDREADNFPRKIYLKDGGAIEVGKMVRVVDNPFWENAMGKKGPFRRKVTMIDGDHVFFSDGSNSSLQYVKMELGGEVMLEPTILQNNPDYITSTATMSDYFAKGGKISSVTTYVPNRSIKELSVLLGKKLKTLKGSDVVDGVYVKNDALKTTKSTSLTSVDGIFEDVISMAKTKRLEDDINIVKKDDIQKLLDAGYDNEDIMVIYFGPTALTNVNIDNEIGLGLFSYTEDYVPEAIEKLIEASKNKTYELGLKYPDFTWSDIIKKYKIDKSGKDVNGEKRTYNKKVEYPIYRLFEGDKVVVGTKIDRITIINGKKDDNNYFRRDLEEVNNFKGGYWGVVSSDKKIIKDIAKMILRKKSGYVKDIDIFVNGLGGVDANTLDLNKIPYELGGEVMVEPTILQNNPDYITSTATMSDYFEKGGAIGFDALAKKVAKRYAGKKVKSEYQDEYGKTYSDEEAMEVGRKVAAKVYRQQQAKMAQGGGTTKKVNQKPIKITTQQQLLLNLFREGLSMKEAGYGENRIWDFLNKELKNDYLTDKIFNLVLRTKMAQGGGIGRFPSSQYKWDAIHSYQFTIYFKNGEKEFTDWYDLKSANEMKTILNNDKVVYKLFYSKDGMNLEEVPAKFAKGGAMEHMIFAGDELLSIHKNMLIVESALGSINVIDLSTEPIARRISIEPITGKNTLQAAKEHIDYLVSLKPKTMAMGGSLEGHGLEEGDLIVEDEGAYINVLSEDGKTFYVDLGRGLRETEPPLPFDNGGEVKIGDIARLAAMYNKTGQEVAAAISEGADVEVEHTEDRKKAMRIAVDHLEEDFYYYPKLKAAEGQPDFSDFYEKGGQVPEQFLDSKGERKIDKKSIAELTDYVMALPQTKSIYFNEDTQEYVPSRRKLHADIINKFKKEVVCITKGQPIAIFMGGSPASGKSSFLRKYSPYLLKEEILKIDADEVRAMLPEYDGYNASQTHLETKDIVNTLLSNKNIGIPCDFDLIYDGTMNNVKSYIPLMDILRKRGYKIFIVYMDKVPKDVIIKRALERYKKSGRFVPLEVIEDFFEKGKTAFNQLKKEVDGYMVIDGSNQDYEIIEQGGFKLPTNRQYSKLGTKIDPKDIPLEYKKGAFLKKD